MAGVKTISPINGDVVVQKDFLTPQGAFDAVSKAKKAQIKWQAVPLKDRIELLDKAIGFMVAKKVLLAEELTLHMGRPISQTPGEIDGMAYRGRHMLTLAEDALADRHEEAPEGRRYFMRRQALGTVFAITPWNYPYLTAVNIVIPALVAGNVVLLKPSPQTPNVGENFAEALKHAGLPDNVYQCLHLNEETTVKIISSGEVDYVGFTGSVENGRAVEKAAAGQFLNVGLELGGKDAAYVRADADFDNTVAGLVEGAFFNSGQSCCGIERIYVAEEIYDDFILAYAEQVRAYKLGDPRETETTLGPVVNKAAARRIKAEIKQACEAGAKTLIADTLFPAAQDDTAYVTPQVLIDVNHDMPFMQQETFGPCVGIMSVKSDEDAIRLINDSPYGLTASIWTKDDYTGLDIANLLDVGTVFLNRCDAPDPALAWTGVKNTGRGCSLSRYGYDVLTRLKSFNLCTAI